MKEFTKIVNEDVSGNFEELVLTFKQREKSRLKVCLPSGEEVGLFLPRGTVLKEGDVIATDSGECLKIIAAAEKVSTVTTDDGHLLLRIAYHLGNRHVPLQVESTWLRYAHDHVLDDMVRLLGGEVVVEEKPLQPESGAYGGGHSHGHDH
ncbi:MAG: urease accessory protein UreE [Thiomicrorhabdus chilensis]|uniref:urease accessory protein UreE n=1 Tax=Thiomicrorhabdus chilensis TaxID=63656 RepID=UPI00299E68C8|nr:urease accessory protein UreE [Thiomicrorhabdus chilensis]MDX1347686.1 urease accessory protein UreE [Thiomicrorhabdus chilensis]